jgi:hypothetical protein
MSFANCVPCVYSNDSVERNAPAASGVYGISNSRQWLYIGESDNIKGSLLGHLQETATSLRENNPTGFSYELSTAYNRVGRQDRLVIELAPVCQKSRRG